MEKRDLYADVIIDISHESLDKAYQYLIPKDLEEKVVIGSMVEVPFGRGNKIINGYVIEKSYQPKWEIDKIKAIKSLVSDALVIEGHLIQLAYWIKTNFGSTMNDALKTVIPVKKTVEAKTKRTVSLLLSQEEANEYLQVCKEKKYVAKVRLLEALIKSNKLDYNYLSKEFKIYPSTFNSLLKEKVIAIDEKTIYRTPVIHNQPHNNDFTLTDKQLFIVNDFASDYKKKKRGTYLIHGVTASGKTEVYIEIISNIIKEGKQVIVLIPEIALTYQTVSRFYEYFGDRVSIMNSRLSKGERYDQYLRIKNGEVDIVIGPRSALFAPFNNLGLIIIDEEHEDSYKSDTPPKYHAREVAIKRASLTDSSVILASATPSINSYKNALDGNYKLYNLPDRVGGGRLPNVSIVDLREELKEKNTSIFSRQLALLMKERLDNKEQIILFINRRGYAGFISCRSCGHVMKCPHCDISLTSHNNKKLICHYCGYDEKTPKLCPNCGSRYIAAFGTGTQKIESYVNKAFPSARVLRMDADTTRKKNSHQEILSRFAKGQADILIGTQMIIKGHDFPNVTLVGILAADLSLYAGNYMAAEKTFQLLVQASGRAGRGNLPGEVVIQTYNPDHYSIVEASKADYIDFYKKEIEYRKLLAYPPISNILEVLITSEDEEKAYKASKLIVGASQEWEEKNKVKSESQIIGPAPAKLAKAKDFYRFIIYVKQENYRHLILLKDYLEGYIKFSEYTKACNIFFDFNPLNSY
ncbi:MAG TPA: primosomal protein N' [Clostridiales bacterium]|nr:primosomal protein N' [Clostridiales bacterium]